MTNRARILLVVTGLALGSSARLWSQDVPPQVDTRWRAFLGCWESSGAALQWVCVIPAPGGGTSGVDLVTVTDGKVTSRERVSATGERVTTERDGCRGWESAEWSGQGPRVYLRAEALCAGGAQRNTSGIIAMSPSGEWLYVESVRLGGGQTGIRVARYREASAGAPLPAELAAPTLGAGGLWDKIRARVAAGAPLTTNDVIEASHHVDGAVVEAWLAERGERFAVDAKRLVALADGGVEGRVIDLLVAMAYPEAFARSVGVRSDTIANRYGPAYGFDPLCDPAYPGDYAWSYGCAPLGYWSRYGGNRYNGGWYPDGYPVIIVYQGGSGGGGTSGRAHGRVVKDRGYSQGEAAAAGQGASGSPSRGTGTQSPSGGSSSGSSSSGGGEQRTAKPRPPN